MTLCGRQQSCEFKRRVVFQTLRLFDGRLAQTPVLGVCDSARGPVGAGGATHSGFKTARWRRRYPQQCRARGESLRGIAEGKNRPFAPAHSKARFLRANGGCPCAFAIQRQQAFQDIGIAQVLRPAVGGKDGLIECPVGILKPLRTLVVKVRQSTLL